MFSNKQLHRFLDNSKQKKLDIALTYVETTTGSSFSKKGSLMLVNSDFEFTGVLGSGFLQEKVKENSKIALKSKEEIVFETITKDPSSGHGNSKYKTIPFYFENDYEGIDKYINKVFSLLIFGSGAHISPLISMANLMGWKTTIIDVQLKKQFCNEADKLIDLEKLEDIKGFDFFSYDAAVILSHNPKTDDTYLECLLKTDISYIGLMGNKKNAKRKKEQFHLEKEERFFAPIGIDIGSYTPESIALSICSQIEVKKNGKL